MPSAPELALTLKRKLSAKRRPLPASLTGAALHTRAQNGDFARGIDWAVVGLAHASRRKRTRAA